MTIKEKLIQMRELLSDSRRWTKNTFAKDRLGRICFAMEGNATCWCLLGAARKVCNNDKIVVELESRLNLAAGGDAAEFNDYASHKQVLRFLDRLIAEES